MERELIFETPGIVLWFYPKTRIIHHELQKYPGVVALESALEKGLGLMHTRRARKWLSDNRRGGAVPKSHHEWALTDWGPRAAAAGWKYWALILPEELLGFANTSRLIEVYASLGVTAKTFDTPEPAMHWLLSR
jgi:hypothetical protein